MSLDLRLAGVLRAGSSFLFVVLGLFILRTKPHRPVNTALGLLCLFFGSGQALSNLLDMDANFFRFLPAISLGTGVPAIVTTGFLILRYPKRANAASRRHLAAWAALAGAAWIAFCAVALTHLRELGALVFHQPDWGLLAFLWWAPWFALLSSISVLVAHSAYAFQRTTVQDVGVRRHLSILALSFGLYVAFFDAAVAARPPFNGLWWGRALVFVIFIAASLTWLRATTGPGGRLALITFLALFGAATSGCLYGLFVLLPHEGNDFYGTYGLLRLAGVALLVHGIFQHNLLRLDLRPSTNWIVAQGNAVGFFLLAVSTFSSTFVSQEFGLIAGSVVGGIAGLIAHKLMPRKQSR